MKIKSESASVDLTFFELDGDGQVGSRRAPTSPSENSRLQLAKILELSLASSPVPSVTVQAKGISMSKRNSRVDQEQQTALDDN